ncbi:MAG: hypothetical protein WBA97_28165 [Actinophytocola sp.]|uniref:hypothetical protein n=1 Tax=Actinophytocola sp. TaxID=1872138 RepID=UPI003C729814
MLHPTTGRARGRTVFVTGALLAVLTACTQSPPDPGPRFDDETTNQAKAGDTNSPDGLACMKHQPHPPGPRYTDKSLRRTDDSLALLRYYTANGTKPYCDNKGPTETDRQWARIYVRLGADSANIATVLDDTN